MQINQLPSAASLNLQDKFAVDATDGVTKSITAAKLRDLIRANSYGAPLEASTVAGMTDTSKVYVYTGNETGYTNGNWYYYNGTAWVSGGAYNSVAVNTDTTLTLSGVAADAKAVGDRISAVDTALSTTIADIQEDVEDINLNLATEYDNLAWPVSAGQYCIHAGMTYKANQDIPTIESWNASHWTRTNLGEGLSDLSDVQGDIAGLHASIVSERLARQTADTSLNNAISAEATAREAADDVMVASESNYVDACRNNDVLMDANDAEPNTIYRLYFRWRETIHVAHLPFADCYSTVGVLFTFGAKNGSSTLKTQILITEEDGLYTRYASSQNIYSSWRTFYDKRKPNYVVISPTDDVIAEIINANQDIHVMDIYFNPGDYDVLALYERHFGSDFWSSYAGYDSGTNSFGRGLVLGNGKHYHFSDRALFHANYSGSNTNVKTYFSMFAPEYGGGFVIDGLRITECSGLHYAIHSDFTTGGYSGGVGELKNCYFDAADWCIGAGLHNGVILKLTDCIFKTSSDVVTVYVHTPNTNGDSGRLIVDGCYFSNRLQISAGGSNTTKSEAIVSNSSLVNLVNVNNSWDVTSFNIERRSL